MSKLADYLRRSTLLHRIFVGTPWRGIYPTFQAALAAIPAEKRSGYNCKAAAETARTYPIFRRRHSDYATLFHLNRLLVPGARLMDFGGNVGIAYYILQQHGNVPRDIEWVLCDVPAIIKVAKELARTRPSRELFFTTDFHDAQSCDILLTAGALQYVEEPLDRLLSSLVRPPQSLLINRVPVWDRRTIYTRQNIGAFSCPYRVMNQQEFVDSILALGYRLVDDWDCPESSFSIRFHPRLRLHAYRGFYFEKEAPRVEDAMARAPAEWVYSESLSR